MVTSDMTRLLHHVRDGKSVGASEPVCWQVHARVDKYWGIDLAIPFLKERFDRGLLVPDDYSGHEGNLLMTVGANDLFTGLATGTLAVAYNSTNTQLGVSDGSGAAAAGNTDLGGAAGTKLNAADPTGATNATPIVVTATFSPTPLVGQVVVCSAFSGAGASAINQTFELSVASSSAITLLNSAGSGAITLTGGLVKPLNRYMMLVNGAPVVSTNTYQAVAVFAAANANYIWNDWCIATGGAATNKQAAPPPHMYNRAVPASLGTKTSAGSFTLTVTASIA